LSPRLEGVAENVALAPISACSQIGSSPLPPSLRRQAAWPRPSRAFSLVNTKATAMRVLSLSGKPLVSWSGPAVSTLIRKVFGLRRYRPGRFVREAAMTSMGSLAGTRRCISPHVFAAVGRLLSALRPMAPPMPSHKDREKGVGAEACPRS
jgi:hypothetical protein